MSKNLLALLAIVILETSALAVEKIRMGFPDLAAPFVPLAIADRRGFFQDEGLRGEFIRINPAIDELKKLGKAEREISLSEVADLSILKEAQRELGIMTAR